MEPEGGAGVFGMGIMGVGDVCVLGEGFLSEEDGFASGRLEGEVGVGDSELFAEVELCGYLGHLIMILNAEFIN